MASGEFRQFVHGELASAEGAEHKDFVEQIIQAISAKLGISETVVKQALQVVLSFAQKKMAPEEFSKLLAEVPGAASLLEEPGVPSAAAGLLGSMGSFLGGELGEAAKAYSDLQAAGLAPAQIPPFVQVFLSQAREVAGPEMVDAILDKIPLLKGLVAKAEASPGA